MAKKSFEIQGAKLRLGGLDLEAGTTSVVIPGVTQAATYFASEVEEVGGSNPDVFGNDSNAIKVIDNSRYLALSGTSPSQGYSIAGYSVQELEDGKIEDIYVEVAGVFGTADKTRAEASNMWAIVSDDPYTNFVAGDWTQIPFRPKMRADEVENTGSGSGLPNYTGVTIGNIVVINTTIDDTTPAINGNQIDLIPTTTLNANDWIGSGTNSPSTYAIAALSNGITYEITGWNTDANGDSGFLTLGAAIDLPGNQIWPITITSYDYQEIPDGKAIEVGDHTWRFDEIGNMLAAGDITTGVDGQGGKFIQDCADGSTSIRWINISQDDNSTQLIRAYTGDPKLDNENERAQIEMHWLDADRSGLTVRSYDRANTNNTVNHSWHFRGDGNLEFPDGTVQNTAYTGQTAGYTGPLYVMANLDGKISTSLDGTVWTSAFDTGMSSIGTVAVGPDKIIYTFSDVNADGGENSSGTSGLYSTTSPRIQPSLIPNTNNNDGADCFWLQVQYFDNTTYPWVAVGFYQPGAYEFPILAYSADGISWTFANITDDGTYAASDLKFTDIAYGNGTYLISSLGSSVSGGLWVVTDLTAAITNANQVEGIDENFKAVEYFGSPGGFVRWNAFSYTQDWWATNTADPTVSGDWAEIIGSDAISGVIQEDTNLTNQTIEEVTSGVLDDGTWIWMTCSSQGHIVWWPNAPAGPFVSIPSPYTLSIANITSNSVASISFGSGAPINGEKIVITGVSPSDFNGTYYYNSGDTGLYTDTALTIPFDTQALTYITGGTVTRSIGTYIDSLGYAAGKFYCGNDDDEIFEGVFTPGDGYALTWTKVDDKNNSLNLWNDFAYYDMFTLDGGFTGDISFEGVKIIGQAADQKYGMIKLVPAKTAVGLFGSIDFEDTGQFINIYPTNEFDTPHIHIAAGVGQSGEGDLFLGDDDKYVQVDHLGEVSVQSQDPDTNATHRWVFNNDGTLSLPGDGLIQSVDGSGILRSQLRLDSGSDITRLSGWSTQSSHLFITSQWDTGTYVAEGITGSIQFTGAQTIINWLETVPYAGRFAFSVNDGPLLISDGYSSGGGNITFYVPVPPATSPTTVTNFIIYYQFESMLDIDTDGQEFSIIATENDLILETRQSGDISINAVNNLSLTGNGIVNLRNTSADNGIQIRADDGDHTWNFGVNGTLEVPLVDWNYVPTTYTSIPVTYGATTLTFTVLPDNTIINMSVATGAGGYVANSVNLTIPGTTFPGGTSPTNDIVFDVQTFESSGPVYSTDPTSEVSYVSGTPPQRYDNIYSENHIGVGVSSNHWVFRNDGYLKFPDNTVQVTAWTGGIPPTSSKGAIGDKVGMIAADSGYLYVCTTDYTNGIPDIWSRTAITATTW